MEQGLGFWARDYWLQVLRGPGSPFARMQGARRALDGVIFEEIAKRRRTGERGEDVLSLLLDATDEDGNSLNNQQIRDEVMTLLFAGHDTTTSTIAFMFYELARHPDVAAALHDEQKRVLGDERPDAALLMSGQLEQLEMVVDETLRMYPPAWIGARKSIDAFEFAGKTIPGGAYVNYSSWVSHHLPHVFPEPEQFRPERFAPEAKAALPEGRLRAVRRRLPDLHRDALRSARGQGDRDCAAAAVRLRTRAGVHATDSPDANDWAARRRAADHPTARPGAGAEGATRRVAAATGRRHSPARPPLPAGRRAARAYAHTAPNSPTRCAPGSGDGTGQTIQTLYELLTRSIHSGYAGAAFVQSLFKV